MIELEERIRIEAGRPTNFGRTLLLVLGFLLYCAGYGAAVTVFTAWFVVKWVFAALKTGWRDGRRAAPAYR